MRKHNDPVKHCTLYKELGCSFVDDPYCDFPECSMYKEYEVKKSSSESRPKTIAFDFDGVIHKYRKGWQDGSVYDEIEHSVLKVIKKLLEEGHSVFIMSTRSKRQIKRFFDSFIVEHEIFGMEFKENTLIPFDYKIIPARRKFWSKKYVLGICNHKVVFDVLVDDRAINFDNNKIDTLMQEILDFKPSVYPLH